MTTIESLDDARAFFEQIVKPSVSEFLRQPSQLRTAFNTATALFHLHEWLFEFKKAELEARYTTTFASKGAFWGHVETLVPLSKFIRDLANDSKYVKHWLSAGSPSSRSGAA